MINYASKATFENTHKNDTEIIGGEATIYINGVTAIKIYVDNGDVDILAKENKVNRLIEFSKRNPNFEAIFPKESIYIEGKFAGFSMDYIDNSKTLSELIIDPSIIMSETRKLQILIKMAEVIEKIHNAGFVIGDLHLAQILVTKIDKMYFIDTDSWGNLNYSGCEVDMVGDPDFVDPQVIDTSRKEPEICKYTQESDLYSFAIIAFYVLTGIHPFSGKYSRWKAMPKNIRAANMLSIIGNHDIEYDSSKVDLKNIKGALENAFMGIFERGERRNIKDDLIKQLNSLNVLNKVFSFFSSSTTNNKNVCIYDYELETNKYLPNCKIKAIYTHEMYTTQDNKVIKVDVDGNVVNEKNINEKVDYFFFADDRYYIKIQALGFWEKLKNGGNYQVSLYKEEVLQRNFIVNEINSVNIYGNYLYYIDKKINSLIRITVGDDIEEITLTRKNTYFEYEGCKDGDYATVSMNGVDLEIDINGEDTILKNQIPLMIKYDEITKQWIVITKKHNGKNNTVIFTNGKKIFETPFLNYVNVELDACDYFHGHFYIPAENKVIVIMPYKMDYVQPQIQEVFVKGMTNKCALEAQLMSDGSKYMYIYDDSCNVYRIKI